MAQQPQREAPQSRPAQVYHVQSALSSSQAGSGPTVSQTTSHQSNTPRNVRLEVPRPRSPDESLDATSPPPIIEHLSNSHRRMKTNLDQAPVDSRSAVKYFVKRPMARFIHYEGKTYKAGDDGSIELATFGEHARHNGKPNVDHLAIQRERLDLFVDLLWVGIISNISELFFSQAFEPDAYVSGVFSQFILLFLPTWSFWLRVQAWLNLYYLDDFIQRLLILWLLILAMIWGNNTPSFLSGSNGNKWLISCYLIGMASMKAVELLYCIWIPWIRRQFFIETALFVPASVLWSLAASVDSFEVRYAVVSAAVTYEWVYQAVLNSPLGDMVLGKQFRKAQDNVHMITRYGSFFTIALGEGVFLLIRNSPLGQGLTQATGIGAQALIIYFFISITYFRGDFSKHFMLAQHRSWYLRNLWALFHTPLFCALVLLSSGVLYLVEYALDNDPASAPEPAPTSGEAHLRRGVGRRDTSETSISLDHTTFRVATTTFYVALSVIYASMLLLSMLNRSDDGPRELVVPNRYIRMLPRLGAIIAFATMWLYDFSTPQVVVAWALFIVWLVFLLEGVAGMDRWPGFFEPRNKHILTPNESGLSSSRD